MPQNCSADVQRVIAHVDQTFTSGTPAQKVALKSNWGLSTLEHLDDVAGARMSIYSLFMCLKIELFLKKKVRNDLWYWQSLQPASRGGIFYQFCDALEVKDGVSAPATGWGLEHATLAWGKWWNSTFYETRWLL
jgi:hypothetical protein